MFKDLKIIELAGVLAGPATGMFFAELGAKVIKIENPLTGGDVTRTWKLPEEDPNSETSAYYHSVNWNKEVIYADLTRSEDREIVLTLIKESDIVISNYKRGDDIKFGVDYETLKKEVSTLIYATITGFGQDDDRPAFDVVLQAESGFMSMNGTEESGPLKMPVALIDILAAHQLKEAILLALINRMKTGHGSLVSVSLYETALASLANQASSWLMNKKVPTRLGSLHPNIAPYGETFLTADGKEIVLAIGSDKQFEILCDILCAVEIKDNELFKTNILRVKNRQPLFKKLSSYFILLHSAELVKSFNKRKIPAGIIKNIKEVLDSREAEHMILTEEKDNSEKSKRVKTVAFKTSFL